MRRRGLGRRPSFRVEVQGERFSRERDALPWRFDCLEAVPGALARLEEHRAIRKRQDPADPIPLAGEPRIFVQFERAAPGLLPLGIQVHDEVETAMPTTRRVVVEVDVGIENSLVDEILVRPAADVVGVVQEAIDARDPTDPFGERCRAEQLVGLQIGFAEPSDQLPRWPFSPAADRSRWCSCRGRSQETAR